MKTLQNIKKNFKLFSFSPSKLSGKNARPTAHSASPFTFHFSHVAPAFTLAEVLIVVGIIGIIATITITNLILDAKDMQYKAAYKKAYSDISRAFEQAIQEKSFTARTKGFDTIATASEWNVMKKAFKTSKECSKSALYDCWIDADKVCVGCAEAFTGWPKQGTSESFIDISGRAWAQYHQNENIYLVDTNGAKGPNRFGKDRWVFTLRNTDGTRTTVGYPAKVGPFLTYDVKSTTPSGWCQYPPCYYYSWLYGN